MSLVLQGKTPTILKPTPFFTNKTKEGTNWSNLTFSSEAQILWDMKVKVQNLILQGTPVEEKIIAQWVSDEEFKFKKHCGIENQ